MRRGGAAGNAPARVALGRAADWLRCHVAARDQPSLAGRLLDAAAEHGLDGTIWLTLDPVRALGGPPGTTRGYSNPRWQEDDPPPQARDMRCAGPPGDGGTRPPPDGTTTAPGSWPRQGNQPRPERR
jgi:hypothetical protein